jgi:hypothetical protein
MTFTQAPGSLPNAFSRETTDKETRRMAYRFR